MLFTQPYRDVKTSVFLGKYGEATPNVFSDLLLRMNITKNTMYNILVYIKIRVIK